MREKRRRRGSSKNDANLCGAGKQGALCQSPDEVAHLACCILSQPFRHCSRLFAWQPPAHWTTPVMGRGCMVIMYELPSITPPCCIPQALTSVSVGSFSLSSRTSHTIYYKPPPRYKEPAVRTPSRPPPKDRWMSITPPQ